jgi:DNA repair exonuclease SbcCD ATPase subunit
MKNIWLILLSFLFLLPACTYQKKIQELERQNDSLRNLVQQSDYNLQKYLSAFNEIQENLNKIKQKENIITVQTTGVEGELSDDVKQQINEDILTIYRLMEENKQKLEQIKRQLRASRNKNKELLKTIQLYEQQLQAKDEEITQLKQKLAELNINIQQLNQQIAQMEQQMDTLKQVQQQQQQTIEQQDKLLHTAYYVVGTKQELKDHGVVDRQGLLAKLTVTGNFDKSFFNEIDTRKVTEIPIFAKKIEILTTHPSDSYELEYEDKVISKIKITDTDKFWETSKFLVIMVK